MIAHDAPTPEVTDKTRLTDDPRQLNVIMVGLIGAILMVAIIIATQGIYLAALEGEKESKLYSVRDKLFDNQLQQQRADLADYRYVDEARGVVQIPVDRAIDLFLKEMSPTAAVGSE
jgi:hypothetical protein